MSNFSEVLGFWAIFGSSKKFQTLRTRTYYISFWSGWSRDSKYIICFAKNSNFGVLRKHLRISRNTLLLLSSRNLNISRNKLIFGISRSRALKWYIICSYSKSLKFFRTSENGLNSAYFAKIAHKIAKPKYFPNIFDDSDSPINFLSDDI